MAELKQTISMGMPLDNWTHKSCSAMIGAGDDWATVYMIGSDEQGKGHATELLIEMKKYYESQKKVFGSTVALNSRMKHLLQKLNIPECKSNDF